MSRRPTGRLSCWAMVVLAASAIGLRAGATPVPQNGAATTTVADTVYMADGSRAQGSLIITWPAFVTSDGTAVAGGTKNTMLGADGALNVGLVSNVGANPAGAYYTVIYQLGPGQVRTEYWMVPTNSPTNLATVRTTPGAGAPGQAVSLQYVDSALAGKANDNAVVHLGGTETISGSKVFATAPSVAAPTSTGQVANKEYVDQSVSTVGAGSYLSTAGGTMTGAITLPADPAAAMQAATKQYVDNGYSSKADVIAGLVPAEELGSGAATARSCLLGNGSSGNWGARGGGSGSGNMSTAPVANQDIAQPAGTQFSTNNLANIRYVTASWNWSQTPADNLATPGSVTIHLSPCPLGIDTSSATKYYSYKVYISGTGTAETAPVTGGSCTAGASSGTIVVTTANAHAAGYVVGSASSGIQEAWNDAWVNDNGVSAGGQTGPYVKLAANQEYKVYAAIYLRGRGGVLEGSGALITCSTRDRCIFVGTTQNQPYVNHHKIYNLSGSSSINVDGVQVSNVAAVAGTYTVTTATTHPFLVGDTVDCEYHSQTADQHWASPVVSIPNSNSFTVNVGTGTIAAGAKTFGFCNILNTFLENNSDHVVTQDINLFQSNPGGMGYFTYGIVNDNDQQFIVERAANRSSTVLHATANWPIGAFLYQRNDQGNAGITYLHSSEFTNVNCATAGGNGLVVTDTVCQGFPTYGFRYFGGLQPATFQNIYQESTGASANPLYGTTKAVNGAAQMGYLVKGGMGHKILGTFPNNGFPPSFVCSAAGAGVTRSYFVVPRGTQGYGPVMFIGSATGCDSGPINLTWPSVTLQDIAGASVGTLTWDVLVTTGVGTAPPVGTGSFALATGISGSCGTNGMCSYADTQSSPVSYTVQTQSFAPQFWFWPTNFAINNTILLMDQGTTAPMAVSSLGILNSSIIAQHCKSGGVPHQRSPIWITCLTSENGGGSGSMATVLQEQDTSGNGPAANSKGRLNFGKTITAPNDIVTLQDSNFPKTVSTSGERPSNDAGDMAIGLDQTGGMAERAATSISEYINAVPSGANYQERLTATAKTFNVPVTVNGSLAVTSGTVTLPVTGTGSQCLHVSSSGTVSGTGADCGSGGGGSGIVNSGFASQLAMYSGNEASVSGDTLLTDTGTTLSYTGSGGIAAATGSFSGNVTVNGQLMVAGPWTVSSPIPGTAMPPAGTGTSSLGISNDGNFYVSTNGGSPQKVATSATSSYFSNLFQEDANSLGQYNGTTGQALHVYGTYTNSSNYERTGLGWDGVNNYFVLKNENAGTGSQHGIGFWIGSGIRWGIDTLSTLKPFSNNAFDIGVFTTGSQLVPRTVYAGTSFDTLTQGRLNFELCNDGTTGTSLNFLAAYNGASPACAVKAGTANTDGVIGIVSNGSGTTGNAVITYRGYALCSFDNATTAGDYVVASTVNLGDCRDAGAGRPGGVQVIGRAESTNASAGTYGIRVSLESPVQAVVPNSNAVPWMPTPHYSTGINFSTAANKAIFTGVILGFPKTTTQVTYLVSAADNTANTYDIGIYTGTAGGTCTQVAHTGSTAGTTFAPTASSWRTLSWTGGGVTLTPGRYYLAYTTSCTSSCATMGGDSAGMTFAGSSGGANSNVSVTSGGTLPATVTCPNDSYTVSSMPDWAVN